LIYLNPSFQDFLRAGGQLSIIPIVIEANLLIP